MSGPQFDPFPGLRFFHTASFPCSYLPGQVARSLVATLDQPGAGRECVDALVAQGFRRSGRSFYRPQCPRCTACRPLRVAVADFRPRRSQRRAARALSGRLCLRVQDAVYRPEHFELYRRYLARRHPGGGMDEDGPEAYRRFLLDSRASTLLVEFLDREEDDRLVMVSVIDVLRDGLSAVYTFFDPEAEVKGLGVFSVLALIEVCRRGRLPHLYLGYWIEACRKMTYKSEYRPFEVYEHGAWRRQPGG